MMTTDTPKDKPTLSSPTVKQTPAKLNSRKTVVVHRGPRDAYEVAAALASNDMLQALVTDLYWPGDRSWAKLIARTVKGRSADWLQARWNSRLPANKVRQLPFAGLTSLIIGKLPKVPYAMQSRATRWTDAQLGASAGKFAAKQNALLLAYSYYASEAFRYSPGVLFQLHPHPASVRHILMRELREHPECAQSLQKELELSIDPADYERLVLEPALAKHCLVASSFTKQTLIENGKDESAISVIPYGVDSCRFAPAEAPSLAGPLRILFVGTITQRKGIKYLLDAVRLLSTRQLELTVCGRAVDDLALFKPFEGRVSLKLSATSAEVLSAYQSSDLFVFPSLAEGFGHVLLEAMASGLPILSTTHTAAPDLIQEGVEGFVVEPRRPDLLAARLDWALGHRHELRSMRQAARLRAQLFTKERFRDSLIEVVSSLAAYS